jgi:Peptidyl-tRNA hydrolase PTH2
VHAAFQFLHDFPSVVEPWLLQSNFLVVVSVPDEDALLDLITTASKAGLYRTAVREPDIGNEATAVALQPGEVARRLCGSLPLALRPPRPTIKPVAQPAKTRRRWRLPWTKAIPVPT